jgi:hypothetical protein
VTGRPFGTPTLQCLGYAVEFGRYGEGGVALMLIDDRSGERYCVASVNLAPYGSRRLAADELWLKTWGGQERIPAALEAAGVVTLTDETMRPAGAHESARARLAKLTPAALAVLAEQETR